MSMLGKQIDELRNRALVLRQGDWSDGEDDALLMESAADTITVLSDKLQGVMGTRYCELFGTPERAARTLRKNGKHVPACYECLVRDECANLPEGSDCPMDDYDALLEWLRDDA